MRHGQKTGQILQNRSAIRILCVICGLLVTVSGCAPRKTSRLPERIIGVKIYDPPANVKNIFTQWKSLGINTVFASETVLTDETFRSLARRNGIVTFLIFPVYQDPEALATHPEWSAITQTNEKAVDDWVAFACPSNAAFRQMKIGQVSQMVRDLDPDCLSIDFIRHFVFWEMVAPDRTLDTLPNTCFCDGCMRAFQEETGVFLPDSLKTAHDRHRWISDNTLDAWVQWKCDLITQTAEAIAQEARQVKPDILINIHAVPWRQTDFGGAVRLVAGQDFSTLAGCADLISPMVYHHMVRRPTAWIHAVVLDMADVADRPILPSIQVGRAYRDEDLTADDFTAALDEALKPPSRGVVFWNWPSLAADLEKAEIVRKRLIGNPVAPQETMDIEQSILNRNKIQSERQDPSKNKIDCLLQNSESTHHFEE